MKKLIFLISALAFSIFFTACNTKIQIQAGGSDEVAVKFSTGFEEETAKALKVMSGSEENLPLFSEQDIMAILTQAGAVENKVKILNPTEFSAEGKILKLSGNQLFNCGILSKTANSITLRLGPVQFQKFYELLSEEFKSYFDLLMIPSLLGEKMSVSEYEELLSSMYGPTFAKDITQGQIEILLKSPDGKKFLKETASLGEILTTMEEKVWNLSF